MKYKTENIRLNDLSLDINNYRILYNLTNEKEIAEYLYEYEDLKSLIISISTKGFLPGERIVVLKKENKNFVCEGNRRIAACKVIKDLIKIDKKLEINKNDEILKELDNIKCDIISNEEDVNIILLKRHVEGPKKWRTLSKLKNVFETVTRYNNIFDIEKLAKDYEVSASKLRQMLKQYSIFNYAINLIELTENEKNRLRDPKLKIDPFSRLFSAKSKKYKQNLFDLLNLKFDDERIIISSSKDVKLLKKAFKIILDYTIFESDINKKIDTRKHVENMPELVSLLKLDNQISIEDLDTNLHIDDNEMPLINESINVFSSYNDNVDSINVNLKNKSKTKHAFSKLKWTKIDTRNPMANSIIAYCREVKNLSKLFDKFPISTTIIIRSLLEICLKYWLSNNFKSMYNVLTNGRTKDPDLSVLINEIKNQINNNNEIFSHKLDSIFVKYFSDKDSGLKDRIDILVHRPWDLGTSPTTYKIFEEDFIYKLIYYILNKE